MFEIMQKAEKRNYFFLCNVFPLHKALFRTISRERNIFGRKYSAIRKELRKITSTVIVALISLVGTLTGSLCGIIVSSKLTNYRIEQLEKKVDKHNNFAEKIPIINERIEEITRRLEVVEREREDN